MLVEDGCKKVCQHPHKQAHSLGNLRPGLERLLSFCRRIRLLQATQRLLQPLLAMVCLATPALVATQGMPSASRTLKIGGMYYACRRQ